MQDCSCKDMRMVSVPPPPPIALFPADRVIVALRDVLRDAIRDGDIATARTLTLVALRELQRRRRPS